MKIVVYPNLLTPEAYVFRKQKREEKRIDLAPPATEAGRSKTIIFGDGRGDSK